ncbi:MAG: aspartate/glutamate racemase family protein [Rudaea sp.]
MTRLAIIHTTTATVESLKSLAAEILPGVELVNFVDDSILPQLAGNGGDVAAVAGRLVTYARFASEAGADAVLEACSSVGAVVDEMRRAVPVPVIRIDEAMAEEAVRRGRRIGVAATLRTTLDPTARLLQQKAAQVGDGVEIVPRLVEGAYALLMAGDRQGHDACVADALARLGAQCDVVVLAQASMARAVANLPEEIRGKFLTSPESAMQRVKRVLEGQ